MITIPVWFLISILMFLFTVSLGWGLTIERWKKREMHMFELGKIQGYQEGWRTSFAQALSAFKKGCRKKVKR